MSTQKPKFSVEKIREIISLNFDARQYFFSKADERWVNWLWDNGLLDVIKEKAEDPTRYGYRTPELSYLVRVASKKPEKVTDIILEVPISKKTFNPEVISQFLRICSTLPASQLARLVQKIKDDGWVELMGPFNDWGFDYEKMLGTLSSANDFDSLLTLIEAVLSVRPYEKSEKKEAIALSNDKPFYLHDLSYTKVFDYLIAVDNDHAEKALNLAVKVMSQVVLQGGEADPTEVFPVEETFHLFDVDFFSIQLGKKEHLSARDDVRELAAAIKVLAEKLIGENCVDDTEAQRIYDQNIDALPQSRAMWRLRLYVLSICPTAFKNKLKESLFSLFGVERYHEIISGTEYENTLKKAFPVFSEEVKRDYIEKVIGYFSRHAEEKEDQEWHRRYGSDILSTIAEYLLEEEREKAEKAGFTINPGHVPAPSIGEMRSGFVVNRGPVAQEEFAKLSMDDIAKKLCNEWTPEELSNHNTSADFLNPLNAEGVGELLRKDIPERLQEYADNSNLFFERDVLDQHYTYSFLRGIQEAIKNNKQTSANIDWGGLIDLLEVITKSGSDTPFDRERREREKSHDTWLSGWDSVHSAMDDVIQVILKEDGGEMIIDFDKYRDRIFQSISYLLSYPDPTPQDEEPKTARMTSSSPSDSKQVVTDPFTMAINTVRGRAFQALVLFLHPDGKKYKKENKIKIADDVKELYEKVLDTENTRAVMFEFGHYIPSFYYRDTAWIHKLIPKLFPTEEDKNHLYLASWEGFLANNLYNEIFNDPNFQKLYERGLRLIKTKEDDRNHFSDPDKGIATHIALAFMHYKECGFDHPLFKLFWERDNASQQSEFVSFVGRSIISGDNARLNKLLEERSETKELLKQLWDWLLKHYSAKELFMEFGFWVSLEKDIFDSKWLAERVKKTLEKTGGNLDWEYGLTKNIVQLANESPEDTLIIAKSYLLDGGVNGDNRRIPLYVDNEWHEALTVLYKNDTTKTGTRDLIDSLVREGGSAFWGLKDILKGS
jgi:hypothetical protein